MINGQLRRGVKGYAAIRIFFKTELPYTSVEGQASTLFSITTIPATSKNYWRSREQWKFVLHVQFDRTSNFPVEFGEWRNFQSIN